MNITCCRTAVSVPVPLALPQRQMWGTVVPKKSSTEERSRTGYRVCWLLVPASVRMSGYQCKPLNGHKENRVCPGADACIYTRQGTGTKRIIFNPTIGTGTSAATAESSLNCRHESNPGSPPQTLDRYMRILLPDSSSSVETYMSGSMVSQRDRS